MAFDLWQVGLAIENGSLCALALQPRRHGWQLRHWWQYRLPDIWPADCPTAPSGGLWDVLRLWRRQLPRSMSLRVSLPMHLIAQRRMAAPDRRLGEPERDGFITARAGRHFTHTGEKYLLDYRADPHSSDTLLVTAARQDAVAQWLAGLTGVGLAPQVLDIMPCALRYMASEVGLATDRLLLHVLPCGWFWVSPLAQCLEFGFIPADQTRDISQIRRFFSQHHPGVDPAQTQPYFSSDVPMAAPDGTLPWSPFTSGWQIYPPIPAWPAAYVVAGGLAIRQEDA
ncbi:pilus assembly protein HofM [Acerihabitans sp. TG2]|uniref:pilus assembly protein HofM n=1 Tax=Acerihabitans sp. TG2 TaxID=3096008 RepID=UPI002B23DB35|nr:pilus assembly protein HofM [Acerihabitans sp. TG2]MEA9390899.1 pilus assembly protein HofM [Acerihabitans sp. TG2]